MKYAFGKKFIAVRNVCKKYQNIASFNKVIAKIKRCSTHMVDITGNHIINAFDMWFDVIISVI